LFVHGIPAEIRTPTFDRLFRNDSKPDSLEESSGGEARLRKDPRYFCRTHLMLDGSAKSRGDALPREFRMDEEQVEVSG
jgi:hypothetical protein